MIVKIRSKNQWIYVANVDEVKTEEKKEEGKPIFVHRMLIFQKNNPKAIIVELNGNVAYLLNDEGKTIERIN